MPESDDNWNMEGQRRANWASPSVRPPSSPRMHHHVPEAQHSLPPDRHSTKLCRTFRGLRRRVSATGPPSTAVCHPTSVASPSGAAPHTRSGIRRNPAPSIAAAPGADVSEQAAHRKQFVSDSASSHCLWFIDDEGKDAAAFGAHLAQLAVSGSTAFS